tara:strand:+ start:28 stop:1071 length:1044 start_codon:yes stop_codon:yes gene_type:complete
MNSNSKKSYSIQELADEIQNGFRPQINLSFGDINKLALEVQTIMLLPNGYKELYQKSTAVVEKSYKKLINPETNPSQRARMVYDIARYDTLCHLMIGFIGNGNLPKELQGWQPKFGINWFLKSMNEMPRSDMTGNMYWHFEAEKIYQDEIAKLQAPSVKDITIEVFESRALMVGINGTETLYNFKQLPEFWDDRSKCPNRMALIMIDLANDYEGLLKEDCKTHKTFGVGVKDAGKQISKLCKALDSIVTTDRVDLKSTNRWFLQIDKRDKQWKPKFHFISSRSKDERKVIAKAVEQNMIAPDIVDSLSQEQKDTVFMLKSRDDGRVISDRVLEKEYEKADKEMNFTD